MKSEPICVPNYVRAFKLEGYSEILFESVYLLGAPVLLLDISWRSKYIQNTKDVPKHVRDYSTPRIVLQVPNFHIPRGNQSLKTTQYFIIYFQV
jgi:hypothetical protein